MNKALCHLAGLGFGLWFNWYVARQERAGRQGFVALWVIVGVLATLVLSAPNVGRQIVTSTAELAGQTLLGVPVIGWLALREVTVEFATTGLPLTLGSLWRYWQRTTG